MNDVVIFWFRRDLRLSDNDVLIKAAGHSPVVPVYIFDESEEFKIGGASKWWLHHSLNSLNKSLKGRLLFFKGDAKVIVPKLAKEVKAKAVYWNTVYEPAFLKQDEAVAAALARNEVATHTGTGTMLWPVGTIVKADGSPFKVYAPYLRAALAAKAPLWPAPAPAALQVANVNPAGSVAVEQLDLLPKIHWDEGIAQTWKPGEGEAQELLASFVQYKLKHYSEHRNYPAQDVLSRLSPYLHYGQVSSRQILHAVNNIPGSNAVHNENVKKFISELYWRDFSYSVLANFPGTATESYNARLRKLNWNYDEKHVKLWQTGQTGIPIIDAGMRQLWQTGYMHNRVRMITASFFSKNLLIDWRTGADWFLDCLVDADLAVNTMNWQWVAGSGLDAAPFFRIFNPVLQSKSYDSEGKFIKRFVPELQDLPHKYIHAPWTAPAGVLNKANVELGKTYPLPCVDLKQSAQAALNAYGKTASA